MRKIKREGERNRGGGKDRKRKTERENARHQNVAGLRRVFFRGTVYIPAKRQRGRGIAGEPLQIHPAARDERPRIRCRYCYYGGSTVFGLASLKK